MKKFIFYCLVFTWLFNIKYNFIPLHPSVTMGVIGAGLLLRDYLRKQWMAYQIAPLSLMVIPFILSIFPAKLINPAGMEIAYVIQNGITPVIYLFAAYFLYRFAVVVYGNVDYQIGRAHV